MHRPNFSFGQVLVVMALIIGHGQRTGEKEEERNAEKCLHGEHRRGKSIPACNQGQSASRTYCTLKRSLISRCRRGLYNRSYASSLSGNIAKAARFAPAASSEASSIVRFGSWLITDMTMLIMICRRRIF